MPVRNQNWYNLQSTRRYPLDDKSTGVDDSGAFIRDDIIVDCHIKFPSTLGDYLYVQGINVSDNLITLVFGVAATLTGSDNNTIAALSIPKPAATNTNYFVDALQPGVSGWVAFGPGIDVNFVGRYSTAEQTFIGLRNARPYRPLPIPTMGKVNLNTALSDLIRLTATSPVTATYIDENLLPEEQRLPKYDPVTQQTNTSPIRALLFSTTAPTAAFNPLTYFLGPCGQRPESGTCPKKPLERINGVEPDCDTGNINIVGGAGLTIHMFEECGGADITTPLGLTEACQQDKKSEKKRKDECCEGDDALAEYCWPPFDKGLTNPCQEDNPPCPVLPICTSFSPCHEALFEVVSGSFSVREASAPPVCCPSGAPAFSEHDIYAASSIGVANIAVYRGCASDWAYNHTISVEVQPRTGGIRQNGGAVINYMKVFEGGRCKTKYVAVVIDIGANELQLYRFDGSTLIKENKTDITADVTHWYKISVTASATGNTTVINALLYDITAGTTVTTLTTTVDDYEAVNGRAGLFANGSIAYFNKFEVV